MLAYVVRIAAGVAAALVDVVAGVEDEVERLIGDVAVRGEAAGLVVTAAADAKAQAIDSSAGGRGGLGAARLADFAAATESVPVLARGGEAARLDMDAVSKFRPCDGGAGPDDRGRSRG